MRVQQPELSKRMVTHLTVKSIKRLFFNHWPLLVVTCLGLIPLTWSRGDQIIAGGDNYTLLNPGTLLHDTLYAWADRLNFGIPNLSTLQLFPLVSFWLFFNKFLGISLALTERLWLGWIYVTAGISMYFLSRYCLRDAGSGGAVAESARKWGALAAAVLYLFNVWVSIDVFTPVLRLVSAFAPLFLLLWMKGLENRASGFRYPFLIGLTSLFIVSSYAQPVAGVAIPLSCALYLIFFLLRTRDWRWGIKLTITTIFFYLIFNLWWLWPYLASSAGLYAAMQTAAKAYQFLWATPIYEAFRFMGFWAFRTQGANGLWHIPYAHFYYEPLFLFLGYAVSTLSLAALIFRPRNHKVIFLFVLALTGVFLAKGGQAPFGFIYRLLYEHLPGFAAFREPFARFTGVTVLGFSLLLGFTVEYLYSFFIEHYGPRLREWSALLLKVWPVIVVAVICIVSFPILTGWVLQDYSWHHTTLDALRVIVPPDYAAVNNWLKQNDPQAKVLTLPRQPYVTCYRWLFGTCAAGPVSTVLLDNPQLIYPESSFYGGDAVLQSFYRLLSPDQPEDLSKFFGFFGVDYVLVQNDVVGGTGREGVYAPPETKKIIDGQDYLTPVKSFGKLDLYVNRQRRMQPEVYSAKRYRTIEGDSPTLLDKMLLSSDYRPEDVYLLNSPMNQPPQSVLDKSKSLFVDLIEQTGSLDGFLRYGLTAPVPGEYELFIRESGNISHYVPGYLRYRLDGRPLTLEEKPVAGLARYYSLGHFHLEKGEHTLEIQYPLSGNVLSDEGFFNARAVAGTGDLAEASISALERTWILPGDPRLIVSFVIMKDLSPGALYRISFWYKDPQNSVEALGIQQSTCRLPVAKKLFDARAWDSDENCRSFFGKTAGLEISADWHYFEDLWTTGESAKTGLVYLRMNKPEAEVSIKAIKLEQLFKASLTAKSTINAASPVNNDTAPKLNYQRLNPAKYLVWPDAGNSAWTLVLNESFNTNWKAYLANSQSGRWSNPLETIFLRPLPEDRHFLVNGIVNGWEVKPEDFNRDKGEAMIILEYRPEIYYVLGLLFLGLGITSAVVYFGFAVLRRQTGIKKEEQA